MARSKEAAQRLQVLFESQDGIEKRYLALTTPPLNEEEFPVGKTFIMTSGLTKFGTNPRDEKMKSIPWSKDTFLFIFLDDSFQGKNFKDIQKAVTAITCLKHRKLASLVCLEPKTGRKHQLRVHISTLNSFILGDYKYGIGCTKTYRHQVSDPLKVPLHLHLYRLVIKNWFGEGNDLKVVSPLPDYWRKTLLSSGHSLEVAKSILNDKIDIPLTQAERNEQKREEEYQQTKNALD